MRSLGVAAISVALILALSGCTAPEPEPEPSPTPTGFTSEEEAFAAAEETFESYIDASNEAELDTPESIEPVYGWLSGEALAAAREEFTMMTASNWTKAGDAKVIQFLPVSFDRQVTADFCVDVAEVEVTNQAGESVVSADRGDIQDLRVVFAPSHDTATGLVITVIGARPSQDPCAV